MAFYGRETGMYSVGKLICNVCTLATATFVFTFFVESDYDIYYTCCTGIMCSVSYTTLYYLMIYLVLFPALVGGQELPYIVYTKVTTGTKSPSRRSTPTSSTLAQSNAPYPRDKGRGRRGEGERMQEGGISCTR